MKRRLPPGTRLMQHISTSRRMGVVTICATLLAIGARLPAYAQLVKPPASSKDTQSRPWDWPKLKLAVFKPTSAGKQRASTASQARPASLLVKQKHRDAPLNSKLRLPWDARWLPLLTKTSHRTVAASQADTDRGRSVKLSPAVIESAARPPWHRVSRNVVDFPVISQPVPEAECSTEQCTSHDRGCCLKDSRCGFGCEDDPCYHPRPLGDSLWGHMHVFRNRGDAAQMVVYDYDFHPGTPELNRYGWKRMHKIAELMPQSFSPVIVEPVDGRPNLSELRRQTIVHALAQCGFPVPAERVRLEWSTAPVLPGDEAQLLHERLLQEIHTGPGGVPGSGGGLSSPPGAPLPPPGY